ncbi:MAG: ADP-ribosylglycohydrolase family protein [Pirellulales bacterium]|nr:ADP-ribosylglycohydrolase family protein [Pirellulales bacterium]
MPTLEDRFIGCLLGLAVGDALGAHFEGQSPEHIAARFPSVRALIENRPPGEIWYTDDTQMTIGVAETLLACRAIKEAVLCQRFAENYLPQRGYGRGARVVIEAMLKGQDHKFWAEELFPGGSFGNGAAMRVAPVGLLFRRDHDELWHQARLSSLPTHVHPLGIEGAQLIANAVALATISHPFERVEYFEALASRCQSVEFSGPLRRAAQVKTALDLALFGNGIQAQSSVVTAIASFGLTPDSYEQTIGNAILLGGDTDTIAAMAGAISGAYLGWQAIPADLLESLEDHHQGRSYLRQLAVDLHELHVAMGT